MSNVCDGNGNCLIQNPLLFHERDFDFKKNPEIICNHNCEVKKCLNYNLCKIECPGWYFLNNVMCYECIECFETYICSKEKQERYEIVECPVCLQTKMCITQPRCNHFTCIDCFKRCYYTDNNFDIDNEPKFPYDKNIKKEFYTDIFYEKENPKWTLEYPLIKLYEEEMAEWDYYRQTTSEKEKIYLRKCPLCRK